MTKKRYQRYSSEFKCLALRRAASAGIWQGGGSFDLANSVHQRVMKDARRHPGLRMCKGDSVLSRTMLVEPSSHRRLPPVGVAARVASCCETVRGSSTATNSKIWIVNVKLLRDEASVLRACG